MIDFDKYRDDPLSRYLCVAAEVIDLVGQLTMVEPDYERNRIYQFQNAIAHSTSIAEAQRQADWQVVQEMHEVLRLKGEIRAKEMERDVLIRMLEWR